MPFCYFHSIIPMHQYFKQPYINFSIFCKQHFNILVFFIIALLVNDFAFRYILTTYLAHKKTNMMGGLFISVFQSCLKSFILVLLIQYMKKVLLQQKSTLFQLMLRSFELLLGFIVCDIVTTFIFSAGFASLITRSGIVFSIISIALGIYIASRLILSQFLYTLADKKLTESIGLAWKVSKQHIRALNYLVLITIILPIALAITLTEFLGISTNANFFIITGITNIVYVCSTVFGVLFFYNFISLKS